MDSNVQETMTSIHRKPKKGILKTSKSFEQHTTFGINKNTKFDEINVQMTYHPVDKDYGHMKIDEPKTPYSYDHTDDSSLSVDQLDTDILAEKLRRTLAQSSFADESDDSDDNDDDEITENEEQLQRRLDFEKRRKMHYNEFEAVRLARQLMEEDEDENDVTNVIEGGQHMVTEDLSAVPSSSSFQTSY